MQNPAEADAGPDCLQGDLQAVHQALVHDPPRSIPKSGDRLRGACHGPTSSVSVVTTPSPRVLSTKFLTARQEANRLFGIRSGSKVSAEARFQRSSQACRSGWVEPVSKKPSGRSSKTSLPS